MFQSLLSTLLNIGTSMQTTNHNSIPGFFFRPTNVSRNDNSQIDYSQRPANILNCLSDKYAVLWNRNRNYSIVWTNFSIEYTGQKSKETCTLNGNLSQITPNFKEACVSFLNNAMVWLVKMKRYSQKRWNLKFKWILCVIVQGTCAVADSLHLHLLVSLTATFIFIVLWFSD